jgi:hypothetical protein
MERPAWAAINAQISAAREELAAEAKSLGDWYTETMKQAKRNLSKDDIPKYYFRVRITGQSVSLYWVRTNFKKSGDKTIQLHKHVKCDGKYRYSTDAFYKVGPWELELITEVENRAEPIRRDLATAAALSRVLAGRTGGAPTMSEAPSETPPT